MHPKRLKYVPNKDLADIGIPLLIDYPHPGRIPDSVKHSKLCSSSNARSKETDSISKVDGKKYIFHDFVKYPMRCAKDLKREYPLHPRISRSFGDIEAVFYYIGRRNTGTILHRHDSAINILSEGKKRWLMFPPTKMNSAIVRRLGADWSSSRETEIIKWEREFHDKLLKYAEHVYDFIQVENQLLWIPENWYHAVINVTDVRGIVFSFS